MRQSTKDEAKGKMREVKGKIKEKVGRMTNDPDLEGRGTGEKIAKQGPKESGSGGKSF